jgi:hypothetical protein
MVTSRKNVRGSIERSIGGPTRLKSGVGRIIRIRIIVVVVLHAPNRKSCQISSTPHCSPAEVWFGCLSQHIMLLRGTGQRPASGGQERRAASTAKLSVRPVAPLVHPVRRRAQSRRCKPVARARFVGGATSRSSGRCHGRRYEPVKRALPRAAHGRREGALCPSCIHLRFGFF